MQFLLVTHLSNHNIITLTLEFLNECICSKCNRLFPFGLQCRFCNQSIEYILKGSVNVQKQKILFEHDMDEQVWHYMQVKKECGVYKQRPLFSTPITLKKPLNFIHITKTGGSSIETWGKNLGFEWGIFSTVYGKGLAARGYSAWHIGFTFLPQSVKDQFDWFCVVRDPYTRIFSEVYCPYAGRDRPKRRMDNLELSKKEFNDYVQRKIISRSPKGDHYAEQHLYLEPGVHILKFEHLAEDFALLMERYGLPTKLDKNLNTASHTALPKFTIDDLSKETMDLIHTVYAKDFALLGYQLKL